LGTKTANKWLIAKHSIYCFRDGNHADSERTYFRDILYLGVSLNCIVTFRFRLKSEEINRHCTWTPTYIHIYYT